MFNRVYHFTTLKFTRFYVWIFILYMHMCGKFWKQVNGIWLPLDRNLGFHTLRWIVNGQYESGEIAIIKKTLSKEDKVLEIGSGLGFVTSFCSLIAGSDQVITYEANPSNAESAMRVFDKNQVSPEIRIALLGETNGVVLFPVNRTKRLASTILDPTEEVVEIAVESLNGLICQWKPTFLIMDIEGAEYDIFRIIQPLTIKKIQFELHPEILGESKCSEIFKQLDIMGFHKDEKISQHPNYYFSIHDES